MKKALILALLGIPLVLVVFWFIAVPERYLADMIENSLDGGDLVLRVEGLKKGVLFTFTIDRVSLTRKGESFDTERRSETLRGERPLVTVSEVRGKVDLLSVVALNPSVAFEGGVSGGRIDGTVRLAGKGDSVVDLRDVRVEGVSALEAVGIHGKGALSGDIVFDGKRGEAKFLIKDAKLGSATFDGVVIPLEFFREVRGALSVADNRIILQSLNLRGEGITARVKGDIVRNSATVNVEIMIDSSFQSVSLLDAMLERYRVTPGYYVIPVRTAFSL